jgi:hypothetical protein
MHRGRCSVLAVINAVPRQKQEGYCLLAVCSSFVHVMAKYGHILVEWLDIGMFIRVECLRCGREASVDPRPLARRYGAAADPRALPWRCTGCRGRRVWCYVDTAGGEKFESLSQAQLRWRPQEEWPLKPCKSWR